jgi:hypothetical protein
MKNEILDEIKETVVGDEKIDSSDVLYDLLDCYGGLHEIIDSHIDTYNFKKSIFTYSDLREWAVDNWKYVEDALEEGICEGVNDYHKMIQAGQYMALSEDARRCVDELFNEYNGVLFNKEVTA